jgi:hypothetical protein
MIIAIPSLLALKMPSTLINSCPSRASSSSSVLLGIMEVEPCWGWTIVGSWN